jgi:hypothetical protein
LNHFSFFKIIQVGDGAGKETYMVVWNHPGVDVTGMVARCEKVAGTCEKVKEILLFKFNSVVW